MTSATFSTSIEAQQAAVLLEGYHFELGQHDARQWVSLWLESYRPNWIRDAVIEALYQGRYKSVSVRQILEMWQRRGQPIRHATHDFEAAVCREFGEVRLAPIAPEQLPEPKPYRSIVRASHEEGSSQSSLQKESWREHAGAVSSDMPNNVTALKSSDRTIRTSKRTSNHRSNAVSFDLAALPPASPGMNARGEAVMNQPELASSASQSNAAQSNDSQSSDSKPKAEIRDNRDWREFPGYTTPTYSASSPDEVLRAQRQFNGVLYSSARAIQPFKPALPFSAQTLRLARQKAIALMNEATQQESQRESRIAQLYR